MTCRQHYLPMYTDQKISCIKRKAKSVLSKQPKKKNVTTAQDSALPSNRGQCLQSSTPLLIPCLLPDLDVYKHMVFS